MLWNHHHQLVPEFFIFLTWNLVSIKHWISHSPIPPAPDNHRTLCLCIWPRNLIYSFLLWLASLPRERHPASTWFRNSQVQSKSKPMRVTRTSQRRPASEAFRTVLEGQEEPSQWEAVVTFRGETAGEACESRSIIKTREGPEVRKYGNRKGPRGLLQDNTTSLHLTRTTRTVAPESAALLPNSVELPCSSRITEICLIVSLV